MSVFSVVILFVLSFAKLCCYYFFDKKLQGLQVLFDSSRQIVLLIVVAGNDLTKNRQGPGIKFPDPCA